MFSKIECVRRVGVNHEQGLSIESLFRVLTEAGYAVQYGHDGAEDSSYLWDVDIFVLAGSGAWLSSEIEKLRGLGSLVPLIALCTDLDPELSAELLKLGADDCMPSTFNAVELEARLEAVLRRSEPASQRAPVDLEVCAHERSVRIQGRTLRLPPTPFRLLLCLAENRGRWVSRAQIVAALFGGEQRAATSVIRVHVHTIREALGPLARLVESDRRYGRGYRLRGDAAEGEAAGSEPKFEAPRLRTSRAGKPRTRHTRGQGSCGMAAEPGLRLMEGLG